MVDDGGGTDASTMSEVVVNDLLIAAGASVDIVIDVVVDDVEDATVMSNLATYDAGAMAYQPSPRDQKCGDKPVCGSAQPCCFFSSQAW